ncbi:ribonuclease HII [Sediminicola sp. 1XM1-17]|uniref:ribonuclease HII n=1 Tax=Sediminicola sp. 1XM1-17 TaxID=3127702 RepID=UPI003076D963
MNHRILLIIALLLFSCTEKKNTSSSLLDFVPKDAPLVIKINNLSTLKSELKNNEFLSLLKSNQIYKNIFETIKNMDYLNPTSESLLVFNELGKENFEYLFIVPTEEGLVKLEGAKNKSVETLTYENSSINKYVVGGSTFFSTIIEQTTIISSSQVLLENSIRNAKEPFVNTSLKQLYKISNSNKSATLFLNTKNSNPLFNAVLRENSNYKFSNFSDWINLDFDIAQDHLNFTGISVANDSIKHFTNLFKNTGARTNTMALYAPMSAEAILSYSFDDYSMFAKNQQHYLDRSIPMDTLFNTVEEIGNIYLNGKKAVVLNTFGSEKIIKFLEQRQKGNSTYQGTEIMELNDHAFLNDYFNPLIKKFKANYCTILDNAFIFSSEIETLQTIISNYKNTTTFEKTNLFETANDVLADESNVLFIANAEGISNILKEEFSKTLFNDFKPSTFSKYLFAAQLVADDDFYHINTVVQKVEKEDKSNSTSPLFTIQLDHPLYTTPQFVTDYRTNKKEIVVQDSDNNLYLISGDGKVLWKKALTGKIQGAVQQVDIYKNGRLQLAFNTNNQFLILDRNGNEVPPFNKTFQDGNLNPLAIFDYDGRKDYRFVITQGSKVFMYDNKMKDVKGFKFNNAEQPIINAPQHMRIGNKDYLVFQLADGTLKILNRVGEDRIKVSEKIDFSNNGMQLYNGKFTTTDKKGVLFQIDDKGQIGKTNLNLSKEHGMDASSRHMVLMNDNVLKIGDREIELDLGVYSRPKIFFNRDKMYVSVTDIQNQKIFLFDSQAQTISNFPVFGTSMVDLADMDNDKKLEIVAKDMDNSLIVYKIY